MEPPTGGFAVFEARKAWSGLRRRRGLALLTLEQLAEHFVDQLVERVGQRAGDRYVLAQQRQVRAPQVELLRRFVRVALDQALQVRERDQARPHRLLMADDL